MVCLNTAYFAENNLKKDNNKKVTIYAESIIHLPICTIHGRRWFKKKKKKRGKCKTLKHCFNYPNAHIMFEFFFFFFFLI